MQAEAVEGHMLLVLPDRNIDALSRERRAPVSYDIQEGLRLARNPVHNAYEFWRTPFVGDFDEATARINKGNALPGSRSAWAAVPCGRDCRGAQIDAWAWRRQGKEPGSITGGEYACGSVTVLIPSASVRTSFNGTYSLFFEKPLWRREKEGIHGRSTKR